MITGLVMYVVEVQCHYIDAIVYINNIPALTVRDCTNTTTQTRANYFVIEGENTISVSVKLTKGAPGVPSLKMRLIRGNQGQEPKPEDFLVDTEWDPNKVPAGSSFFTPVYNNVFVSKDPQPTKWGWQQAESVILNDTTKAQLTQFVKSIHRALQNKQANQFAQFFAHKNDELGKSLGFAGTDVTNGMQQQYEAAFGADDWALEDMDVALLDFDVRGNDKLVVVSYNGGPAIQAQALGKPMDVKLVFARISGQWRVVR